jgi:hypothetical protein
MCVCVTCPHTPLRPVRSPMHAFSWLSSWLCSALASSIRCLDSATSLTSAASSGVASATSADRTWRVYFAHRRGGSADRARCRMVLGGARYSDESGVLEG